TSMAVKFFSEEWCQQIREKINDNPAVIKGLKDPSSFSHPMYFKLLDGPETKTYFTFEKGVVTEWTTKEIHADADIAFELGANILNMLLLQNFANKPELVKVAKRMKRPVAVISTDTETEATLEFGQDGVIIYNGIIGDPSVAVHATVDQILDVSQLKMKAGGL